MNSNSLPITISTEYKDASVLLSTLTRRVTESTSSYILALSAFGLSYSAAPTDVDNLLESLQRRILAITPQSTPIAEDVEAVGFAAHVLIRQGKWNRKLQDHQDDLLGFFERVESLQWLRSSTVAMSFLLGFGAQKPFLPLASKARAYLSQKLATDQSVPVAAFGLSVGGQTPEISDTQVQNWLDRTHQPFKYLCMLAVTLNSIRHPLSARAITCLRKRVLEIYSGVVDPNINTIRILLAVIHMAEMGQNADEITHALRRLPIDDGVRNRVSAIIRADSRLFIEFRDGFLAQTPTIDFLAFYLFAANKVGLTEAYIVDDKLKAQFSEFMKAWQNRESKVVNRIALAFLLLVSFVASVVAVFKVWWPISNGLYNWILSLTNNQLVESYLDDILKGIIALPIYAILGSALALWLHGDVSWSDIIGFEGVVKNARTVIRRALGRRDDNNV